MAWTWENTNNKPMFIEALFLIPNVTVPASRSFLLRDQELELELHLSLRDLLIIYEAKW